MDSKILVIDDDPKILELIDFTLSSRGYSVSCAKTPREAVALACDQTPDLILLDYDFPEMNGFELLEMIRGYDDLQDVRVIMISGKGNPKIVKKSVQMDILDFIVKPFKIDLLVQRVQRWAPIETE